MPAWVRKTVQKITKSVTSGTAVTLETDPSFVNEIAAADDQVEFLNLESVGSNLTIKVWRHEGARADLLKQLDATGSPVATLTSSNVGINKIAWDKPAGAARKLSFEISCSSGTSSITLENDTVFRTTGE